MKANKQILILCEGITEYLYARSMQMELPRALQRSVSINVSQAKQQDPKSLVLEAIKKSAAAKKDRNSYDDVWLFLITTINLS
ncbi:RloB domain-containing protein [Pedobacter aquae]|uniref:RloB domain-containing protein n=1 Tax=Pedobacter aquae TaxID=2605747 RepID=A0A5C0VKU8_9SPHI|nr:RloB domain-containing protein [Pedobacter aquae]